MSIIINYANKKKFGFGFNFISSLNDFDKNTGECFLTENQKRIYFFTYSKCNLQRFVDFNIAFHKESKLAVIQERKKEQKETDVSDDDDDDEDAMFCSKYLLHPRKRLKRSLKQKLEQKGKKKEEKTKNAMIVF